MRKSTIWAIAALTVLSAVLFGQAMDSILVGTVNDSSGAAVANATGEMDQGLVGALGYVRATLQLHEEILDAIDPSDAERRPRP